MKIVMNMMIEQGDTATSVINELREAFGKSFTPDTLWDFNRNIMPTPQHFPGPGTMLRVPLDPLARSGGPDLDTLHNRTLTEDELRASSPVLGGLKTPSTAGGEPEALQPVTRPPEG